MQTLPNITNRKRMNGVTLVCKDVNGNVVPLPNGQVPQPSYDQNGVVSVENMAATADLPENSTFTCDVVGGPNASNGAVTINFQTHRANGNAGFTEPVQIVVDVDPSIPGDPSQLVVTPGTIVPQ